MDQDRGETLFNGSDPDIYDERQNRRANLAGAALGIVNRVASYFKGVDGEEPVVFYSIGPVKPEQMLELRNSQLSQALEQHTVFAESEISSYGIDYIPANICIQSKSNYYAIACNKNAAQEQAVVPSEAKMPKSRKRESTRTTGITVRRSRAKKNVDGNDPEVESENTSESGSVSEGGEDQSEIGQAEEDDTQSTTSMVSSSATSDTAKPQPGKILLHRRYPGNMAKVAKDAFRQQNKAIKKSIQDSVKSGISEMASAIKVGVSGAIDEQREKMTRVPRPTTPPLTEYRETLSGVDKETLATIAQAAKPGKRVAENDIQFAALALNVTRALCTQMRFEYVRRFQCKNSTSPMITTQNAAAHMKEILLTYRLLEICIKTQWTRVSTQKRLEVELHLGVKQVVERSLTA